MNIEDEKLDIINAIRVFVKLSVCTGRADVAKNLELGEGVTRRILEYLKEKNLIVSTNKGHKFTEKGISLINEVKKNLCLKKTLDLDQYNEYKNTVILVKDYNNKKLDYKIRDTAIRNGAQAALILVNQKEKLTFPDFEYDLNDFSKIDEAIKSENGDILIITFAEKQHIADISCLFAAYEVSACLGEF